VGTKCGSQIKSPLLLKGGFSNQNNNAKQIKETNTTISDTPLSVIR